jgi:hypothetical protein
MATAEQHFAEVDQSGRLASVAEAHHRGENQYPLPSYQPWQERQDDLLTFTLRTSSVPTQFSSTNLYAKFSPLVLPLTKLNIA